MPDRFALRRRPGENLDLAIVETEAAINRRDLGLDRTLVWQEQACRAALDDGGRDGAGLDIGERLGREYDARVLLPQRFEPLAQLCAEGRVVEREPTLIDDQQRGPPI